MGPLIRLAIVWVAHPAQQVAKAAGQIAERLKIPAPTLSFHLSQLRHAGLVEMRRDGRSLIYAADFDGMNELMGFLTENCCAGEAAGCGVPVCEPQRASIVRKRHRGATRP